MCMQILNQSDIKEKLAVTKHATMALLILRCVQSEEMKQ